MSVALTAINVDANMQAAIQSLMMRSIRLGAIFSTEQNLTDDAYQRLKIDGDNRWSGVQNAGGWMLLEGQLKPMLVGRTVLVVFILRCRIVRLIMVLKPGLVLDELIERFLFLLRHTEDRILFLLLRRSLR